MPNLLDLLSQAGLVLDTPGALVRNTLAGRSPFRGIVGNEERTSGRELLEQYGLLGANEEGLDWGDAAGLGVEILADPSNLLAAGLLAKTLARRAAIAKMPKASIVNELDEFGNSSSKLFMEGRAEPAGEVALGPPAHPETRSSKRAFPGVLPEDSKNVVARLRGSVLDDDLQGMGIGQQLYLDAMSHSPAGYVFNSGNSPAATLAREALEKKGLVNLLWEREPGGTSLMWLTPEGRQAALEQSVMRYPPKPPSYSPLLAATLGYHGATRGLSQVR